MNTMVLIASFLYTRSMNKSQSGSHLLLFVVAVAIIAIIGAVVFLFISNVTKSNNAKNTVQSAESGEKPPMLAKNIGFNFDYYNEATKSAGDLVFADIRALKDPLVGK